MWHLPWVGSSLGHLTFHLVNRRYAFLRGIGTYFGLLPMGGHLYYPFYGAEKKLSSHSSSLCQLGGIDTSLGLSQNCESGISIGGATKTGELKQKGKISFHFTKKVVCSPLVHSVWAVCRRSVSNSLTVRLCLLFRRVSYISQCPPR